MRRRSELFGGSHNHRNDRIRGRQLNLTQKRIRNPIAPNQPTLSPNPAPLHPHLPTPHRPPNRPSAAIPFSHPTHTTSLPFALPDPTPPSGPRQRHPTPYHWRPAQPSTHAFSGAQLTHHPKRPSHLEIRCSYLGVGWLSQGIFSGVTIPQKMK